MKAQFLNMPRYYIVAAALSLGWYPMMLIPTTSREWILGQGSWYSHVSYFAIAGLIVARTLVKFILGASNIFGRIFRAFVVPLCGAFVYLVIVVISWWIKQAIFGGLTNLHDSFSAIMMGLVFTLLSFYVVIPYGIFCQYCLEAAAQKDYESDLE